MDIFNSAQGVSIHTATFNDVQGNQINTTYNQIIKQKEREYEIYDDYHNVISGDVYRFREIHCEGSRFIPFKQIQAERTICHAEIHGRPGFTAVSYRGPDAKKIWEKDFREFSEAVDANHIQLFGLNRYSNVPLLIFHGELVPLAHLHNGMMGRLRELYIKGLAKHLDCTDETEIWIDPKRGTLIRGLPGPKLYRRLLFTRSAVEAPPSSVKFLQDDNILWHYFSQLPLNRKIDVAILDIVAHRDFKMGPYPYLDSPDRPAIVSSLTKFPIAVGPPSWLYRGCLHSGVTMPDGMTRLCLRDCGDHRIELEVRPLRKFGWLSQATSVFDQCGISLDGDLSHFKYITPNIILEGKIESSEFAWSLRQRFSPIYLFIPPFPKLLLNGDMTVSHHFWSSDATGKTWRSEATCGFLGLPTQLKITKFDTWQFSCSTEAYKDIYRWQVDRGFDPKTTDFARYLGYNYTYKVIQPDSSRFEECDGDA